MKTVSTYKLLNDIVNYHINLIEDCLLRRKKEVALNLYYAIVNLVKEYYNNKYGCTCTADYYANDYDEDLYIGRLPELKYKSFAVNLIPNEGEDRHVKNN